nr:gamma-glutamyltransferase [uncultured Steroidobacter sp.]
MNALKTARPAAAGRAIVKTLLLGCLLLLCAPPDGAQAQTKQLLNYPTIVKPVLGEQGMVVSQSAPATQIGRDILRKGGNAVDAAIATAFALAVTLPRAGNIGGDGFMLIHLAREARTVAIDYRTVAPAAARFELYVREDGSISPDAKAGVLSAGVPGTVAGLALAHERYGKLPWRELLKPAIALAKDGVELTRDEAWVLEWGRERLNRSAAGKAAFFKPDGSAYRAGERLRQPDLAWSLRQIANHGADAFYRGPIAQRLAAGMAASGGLVTMADLAAYRAIERPALTGTYRGLQIATMPPSSGGGASVIEMLNILEQFDLEKAGAGSAEALHLIAESMKLAFHDRRRHAGDTDHDDVPLTALTSKPYAQERARQIVRGRVMAPEALSAGNPWAFESRETTHLSVLDAEGNAVSNTFTLGSDFGSGVMMPGTGFLLGNMIGNFSLSEQRASMPGGTPLTANVLGPGRRPVSSMSPTMVLREGKPLLITGSPGGSTIPGTVAQMIVNVFDFGMTVAEATHAPRIYQNIDDGKLYLERGISPDTRTLLQSWGHNLVVDETIGSTQSIMRTDTLVEGSADPRRPGSAALEQ